MNVRAFVGAAAAAAVLAGCVGGGLSDRNANDSEQILEQLRQAVAEASGRSEVDAVEPPPSPVRIPLWLTEEPEYEITDSEPREAVLELVAPRPVRFELFGESDNEYRPLGGNYSKWEMLQAVAVQMDWEIDTDSTSVVVVTDRVTRSYPIAALPGDRETQMEFRGLGAGGVGSGEQQANVPVQTAGGGGQGTTNTLQFDSTPVEELDAALSSALSGFGQEVAWSVTPSASSVVVTGSIAAQRRAEAVITEFNERVNARARVTVSVFEVEFIDSFQGSLDLSLVRNTAVAAMVGLDGENLVRVTDQGLALQMDFGNNTTSFDTAKFVANLLSLQGRTTQLLHESVEITTTDMVSIENTRTLPYVSEISTGNQVGGAISRLSPELEVDELSEGLGVHILGSVSANHEVLNLQLALSQNELVRCDDYNVGEGLGAISGRLPIVDSRHRMLRLTLRDGETRLVANLTEDANIDERAQGIGIGSRAESVRKQTVIVVTANLI